MDGMVDMRGAVGGARERHRIRSGAFTGPTAGMAPGNVQANLVILPKALAHDFLRFAQANPSPAPCWPYPKPAIRVSRPWARTSICGRTCRSTASGAMA